MGNIVTIEYCVPCQFEKQAVDLSEELKTQFGERITEVNLDPTQSIGNFEISLNGEVIYSKVKSGRLPQPGEVGQIILTRIFK